MPSETKTFEHEIRIQARPQTVFAYFTDPAKLVRWMGTDATLDPRPGGIFQMGMKRSIGESVTQGEYVEVIPYERVVFTWGFEGNLFDVPPASTRVEVSLEPDDDATIVRLLHHELPAEALETHRAGWLHYMPRLADAAAGGDPGPDEWLAPPLASRETAR
jgi:uncharacterized protein YndB with AHSA1/START domain